MSTELPTDPISAAQALASLKEKDETRCSYPTCREPRQATTGTTGRPSAYCSNPKHTAVTNHRARLQLQKMVSGIPDAPSKRETSLPRGIVNVEALRSSVVHEMHQLQSTLERYVTILTEIADPDISVAQLQATQDRAEARIAEAQQSVSAERSLRLAAEAARIAARKEAQAIAAMEEAEARTKRAEVVAEQHIAEIQAERDAMIEQIRLETTRQIEHIGAGAEEVVAQAQAATATAEEEARRATAQAHEASTKARTKVAVAEQLVREARTALDRERTEVDRLRSALTAAHTQIEHANARAEADRVEARTTLERERAEVDRQGFRPVMVLNI